MHRHVTLEFARTDTDERDAVAMFRVHICLDLEDESRKPRVLRRNFHAGHHARLGWRRMFQEPVEQKLHAEVVEGAAEEDRGGCVREHGGVIPFVPGMFEHFKFFHRPVESGVVESGADDLLMQCAYPHRCAELAAHGALEQVHLPCLSVEHTLELEAVSDGPVYRERADAQDALQFIEQREGVLHRAITFVDERENRDAALPADLEKLPGLRLDSLGRINHHHRRIHGREHAIGVFGKILVPRRVEQVEPVTIVIELQDSRADGNAALPFQLHPVGAGGALVFARGNRAGELHRAAVQQQLFRQRGLARVRMRNDGERTPPLNLFAVVHKGRPA